MKNTVWRLGTKPGFLERAASVLKHRAISSVPLPIHGGSYLADIAALSVKVNLNSFSYNIEQTQPLCLKPQSSC